MKRLICALLIIGLLFFSSCTTDNEKKNIKNIYLNNDSYVTIIGKISYIADGANNSVIVWIEQGTDYKYFNQTDSFKLDRYSYEELISNDFKMVISDNQFKFTSSEKVFWNGWFYPIVAVESINGEKTYLDFETGKENWLNYIENEM